MGDYDIPAELKYIRALTGKNKITYVGYSEGSTQLVYALSKSDQQSRDFWIDHIAGFFALAPITRFEDLKNMMLIETFSVQ